MYVVPYTQTGLNIYYNIVTTDSVHDGTVWNESYCIQSLQEILFVNWFILRSTLIIECHVVIISDKEWRTLMIIAYLIAYTGMWCFRSS